MIPPTLNYHLRSRRGHRGLDIVHGKPGAQQIDVVASYLPGLGGQNACPILGRFDSEA